MNPEHIGPLSMAFTDRAELPSDHTGVLDRVRVPTTSATLRPVTWSGIERPSQLQMTVGMLRSERHLP